MSNPYQTPKSDMLPIEQIPPGQEDRLVVIAKYETEIQAQIYVSYLEEHGIVAVLQGANTGTVLAVISVAFGGVGVAVKRRDAAQATQLLALAREHEGNEGERSDWVCSNCGESVEGSFDVCWSCSHDRDKSAHENGAVETNQQGLIDDDASAKPSHSPTYAVANSDSSSNRKEIRPAGTEDVDDSIELNPVDDLLRRAFMSAVIGLVIVPFIFHAYSLFLLFNINGKLNSAQFGRFMTTLGVVLFGGAIWITIFVYVFSFYR